MITGVCRCVAEVLHSESARGVFRKSLHHASRTREKGKEEGSVLSSVCRRRSRQRRHGILLSRLLCPVNTCATHFFMTNEE